MQRIVLVVCAAALALSGCAKPTRISTTALPDPLLSTRRPPTRTIVPAPRPEALRPRVAEPEPYLPTVRLNERELIPPGGIKRGRWRVIVVHHSATFDATPESMDEYHRNVRGWCNGLGYHLVIGNGVNTGDGHVYVGSRWERQISGAHCKSKSGHYFGTWRADNYFNAHGIGICLVGDFEQRQPTQRQLAALQKLVQFLCSRTGINPAHIYGHRDVTHKTLCPGRYLTAKLPQVRAAVAQALAVDLDPGPPPGWPSGLEDYLTPPAQVDLHRTLLATYLSAKRRNVAYAGLGYALDHVANLYGGALSRASLRDVDHDYAH